MNGSDRRGDKGSDGKDVDEESDEGESGCK